jgi:branched-chain amino acid transport system substrate-binding protein
MRRSLVTFITLFAVFSLAIAGCQPTTTPGGANTPAPGNTPATGNEVTLTIGFTASQTGSLQVESKRQLNGLNLWMKQVNDAGGIKLKDGTLLKFTAKFYDDESSKDRVQSLYTKLATDDKADS